MGQRVKNIVNLAVRQRYKLDLIWTLSEVETEIADLYLDNSEALKESKKTDEKNFVACPLTIRYLERIADHTSHIPDSITYAATGKQITLR